MMPVFLAAALLATPVSANDRAESPPDLQALQGTWNGVSSEQEGRKVPESQARSVLLIFQRDRLTVRQRDEVLEHALVKLDAGKKPKALDVTPADGDRRGKTLLGIYEIEGDVLKVCIADVGRPRPADFSAKEGTGISLHVLQRERR